MSKYFVGGYYDSSKFLDEDGNEMEFYPLSGDAGVYDLEGVKELGFIKPIIEEYEDNKEFEYFDDLSEDEQTKIILDYIEGDELVCLYNFDNLNDAIECFKLHLEDLSDIKNDFEYFGKEQNAEGIYIEVYKKLRSRVGKILVSKSGGNASANSLNWRVSIPNTWISEMKITKEDREIAMTFDTKCKKIIIQK